VALVIVKSNHVFTTLAVSCRSVELCYNNCYFQAVVGWIRLPLFPCEAVNSGVRFPIESNYQKHSKLINRLYGFLAWHLVWKGIRGCPIVHIGRTQSGGVCPVRTFCGQRGGILQMRTSALFDAKTPDFLKFIVCPYGQGKKGVEPVRTFCGQGGRGSIFRNFFADVFYGRPFSLQCTVVD